MKRVVFLIMMVLIVFGLKPSTASTFFDDTGPPGMVISIEQEAPVEMEIVSNDLFTTEPELTEGRITMYDSDLTKLPIQDVYAMVSTNRIEQGGMVVRGLNHKPYTNVLSDLYCNSVDKYGLYGRSAGEGELLDVIQLIAT
jgi:hypothetical protein